MGRCAATDVIKHWKIILGPIGVGTKKHTFETDERSKIMDNHVELPALKTGHQTTFRSGKTNKWLGSLIKGSTGLLFLISHWWSRWSLRLVNSSLTSSGVLCLGRGVGNSCDWSSFRDWMTRPGAKKAISEVIHKLFQIWTCKYLFEFLSIEMAVEEVATMMEMTLMRLLNCSQILLMSKLTKSGCWRRWLTKLHGNTLAWFCKRTSICQLFLMKNLNSWWFFKMFE